MCGIAGLTLEGLNRYGMNAIVNMAKATQDRGRDGFGIAVMQSSRHHCLHQLVFDCDQVVAFLAKHLELNKPVSVVMSSRAQPLPEADSTLQNIQPYVGQRWTLVHNGTISNDRELAERYGVPHAGIDTQVIHAIWEQQGWDVSYLVGGYAFILMDHTTGQLTFIKNFKTLWHTRGVFHDQPFAVVASEPDWLRNIFHAAPLSEFPLERVPTYSWGELSPQGTRLTEVNNRYWSSTPDLDDQKAVIVTSGGIDSITAAYIAACLHGKQIHLLHADYGQRSSQREHEAVAKIAADLQVPVTWADFRELGKLGASPLTDRGIELPLGMKSVESTLCWTPARNLVFLAMAAAVAEAQGARWIYYGNNMEEEATGYGDNDLEFVEVMNDVLRYATLKGVVIKRALARLMKPEILHIGNFLGVPFQHTWSCDEGFEQPCGVCGCCTTRQYAFKRAGLVDSQTYRAPCQDVYPWQEAKSFEIDQLLRLVIDG